jgi:hypothetical protein
MVVELGDPGAVADLVVGLVPKPAVALTNRVSSWVEPRDVSNSDSRGPGGRNPGPVTAPSVPGLVVSCTGPNGRSVRPESPM